MDNEQRGQPRWESFSNYRSYPQVNILARFGIYVKIYYSSRKMFISKNMFNNILNPYLIFTFAGMG